MSAWKRTSVDTRSHEWEMCLHAIGHAVVAAVMLAASATTATPAPAAAIADSGSAGSYIESTLAGLPVRPPAPDAGYERDEFGPRWADVDRNGCDTRNDVLARDLDAVAFEPGTHDCVVVSGEMWDPYTATFIEFAKGEGTSDAVQIDHLVSLHNAWLTGAQDLTAQQRRRLANDPRNLLAVDGPTNAGKGDRDASRWLPPHRDAPCGYVARQIDVKAVYRLWVTAAERDAMARVIAGCPPELLDVPEPTWGITG